MIEAGVTWSSEGRDNADGDTGREISWVAWAAQVVQAVQAERGEELAADHDTPPEWTKPLAQGTYNRCRAGRYTIVHDALTATAFIAVD